MKEENNYSRKEARKRTLDDSRRKDMKQHADKLIQGFGKLGARHAKRAIWELVQNAVDLTEECHVNIALDE